MQADVESLVRRRSAEGEVVHGGYSTASEYIRHLIRQAQRRNAEERLESLLLAGLDSGDAVEMTPQDWAEVRRQVRERLERGRR